MSELKNYRAVGIFDLLSAPVTPIGSFDAEQFKKDYKTLVSRGSVFIAVDLTGIDFLYSDACSAFNQIRKELADKGGAFGLLTENGTVVECLCKAGLNKALLVFRKEADMMAFSMKEDSKKDTSAKSLEEEGIPEVAAKTENVVSMEASEAHSTSFHKRVTGRFTQSFNAIRNDAHEIKGGMANPFQEEERGSSSWPWIILFLLGIAGMIAFLILR
ncbi:MAG: STAS domain-containing protein [Fibrobacteraceae bacterium]|nr:STAS domain-containing protein [Fibrobacteraceae bacterium]